MLLLSSTYFFSLFFAQWLVNFWIPSSSSRDKISSKNNLLSVPLLGVFFCYRAFLDETGCLINEQWLCVFCAPKVGKRSENLFVNSVLFACFLTFYFAWLIQVLNVSKKFETDGSQVDEYSVQFSGRKLHWLPLLTNRHLRQNHDTHHCSGLVD